MRCADSFSSRSLERDRSSRSLPGGWVQSLHVCTSFLSGCDGLFTDCLLTPGGFRGPDMRVNSNRNAPFDIICSYPAFNTDTDLTSFASASTTSTCSPPSYVQEGSTLIEIATNRPTPVQRSTVLSHLADCVAWDMLQPHELQRLVNEAGVDFEVAQAVHSATRNLDQNGIIYVQAALPKLEFGQIKVGPAS